MLRKEGLEEYLKILEHSFFLVYMANQNSFRDLGDKSTLHMMCNSSFENLNRTAYWAYYNKRPPITSTEERRVIRQYLFHTNISIKEVIDRVEKCLTAVFKEKEPPKISKARGYCKLTYPMRLFQVATEKNIADALFPYVKHQRMTMDKQTLVNTLCRLTAPFSRGEVRCLFLSLDFQRWCLK